MMGQNQFDNRPGRTRMAPDARKAQLLEVASSILYERGVEAVRIPEVAERAGVTRPVVYRFFPSRQAIFIELLEELKDNIEAHLAASVTKSDDVRIIVTNYIDAICDAIEASGPGAWLLLSGASLDEEVQVLVEEIQEHLTRPWMGRVEYVLRDLDPAVVDTVKNMLFASARAALGMWLRSEIRREAAAHTLARATNSILDEFRTK